MTTSDRPDAHHVPVLLDRVLALVAPPLQGDGDRDDDGRRFLVDATLGLGGHAEAVLRTFPGTHVIGIDRDEQALERSGARLAPYAERVTLVHAVYDQLAEVLAA